MPQRIGLLDLERDRLEAFARVRDGRRSLLGRATVANLSTASSRSNTLLLECPRLEAVSNVNFAWQSDTSGPPQIGADISTTNALGAEK
ncbi:MAG: hypothetical protein MJA27_07840 [Pseudanabaenales cyanobacterium]|nr:hypothetical protein [Pseudanabaenales cyanobacterium]